LDWIYKITDWTKAISCLVSAGELWTLLVFRTAATGAICSTADR